jgi:hypothetical protein
LADLPGAWFEIPESTAMVVAGDGSREQRPFRPRAEAATVAVPA